VNTTKSCNKLSKFRSYGYKIVAVLTNIEIGLSGPKLVHTVGEDINGKQLGKFSSAGGNKGQWKVKWEKIRERFEWLRQKYTD